MLNITIVYDNNAGKDLKSGWGFSCLIEHNEHTILFDTGCDGPALIYNLKKLNIDIKKISSIFISHNHWDHTAGICNILEENDNLKLYCPRGFSLKYLNELRKRIEVIEVEAAKEIEKNIFSTGSLEAKVYEQAMAIKTEKGLVVIVGCSHPGVDTILETLESFGKIHAIVGGMHDFNNMKALNNIQLLAPCHCTECIDSIKITYPKEFKTVAAGDILTF